MAALEQGEEVRDCLLEAEQQSITGDIKDALRETAIAFQELPYRFEWEIVKQNSIHFKGVSSRHFSGVENETPRELSRFAREIERELNSLHNQLKLLSLGIDYRRYIRFQQLIPIVHLTAGGTFMVDGNGHGQSYQDYLFCYHFVIECALRLQEIQFFLAVGSGSYIQ